MGEKAVRHQVEVVLKILELKWREGLADSGAAGEYGGLVGWMDGWMDGMQRRYG